MSKDRAERLARQIRTACGQYNNDDEPVALCVTHMEAKLATAESQPAVPDAHQLWAAAQLGHGEGITDGIARIEALLAAGDSYE